MSTPKYKINKQKVLESLIEGYNEYSKEISEVMSFTNPCDFWLYFFTNEVASNNKISLYSANKILKELEVLSIIKRVIKGGGFSCYGGLEEQWYEPCRPIKIWVLKDITLIENLLTNLNNQ